MDHKIYIALGTNLGDREFHIREARKSLAPKVCVLAQSMIYETVPWGFLEQPDFLNQVVAAKTNLSPIELLAYLKDIEIHLGRKPTFRNGPRIVDLDILFYDDCVIDEKELVIPHPRLDQRAFVLIPLMDIAPDLEHPTLGCTIKALTHSLGSDGVVPYHRSEISV